MTLDDAIQKSQEHHAREDAAAKLLDEAKHIITGARRAAYGNPEDNFACIAALWTTYLNRRGIIPVPRDLPPGTGVTVGTLTPGDVAVMMILMKCARLAETPGHHDSLTDCAGYAACAARCYEKPSVAAAEPSPAGPPVGVMLGRGMLIRGLFSDLSIVQRICDIEWERGVKYPVITVSRHDIPHSTVKLIMAEDAEVRWPYQPDTAWQRVYPKNSGVKP